MFGWIKKKIASSDAKKSSLAYPRLLDYLKLESASWTINSYKDFANSGYSKNIVAYHCISKISQAVSDVPFMVKIKGKETDNHPLVTLLRRPNARQAYNTFMRQLITYRLISGNCYIHSNIVSTGRIMELINLRPDRVTIRTNSSCEPVAFDYQINSTIKIFPIDPFTNDSEILHLKEPHPYNDLYGMSPMSAAAMSIDIHNESSEWNKKLLENSARPPGILSIKNSDGALAGLTESQIKDMSDKINEKYAGSKNAGKIPLLGFELLWTSMGFTPADMDWLNGKNTTARDICLAFGYPALLLGMAEGSTFNNVSEAKLALYEETVIPLLQNVFGEISHYISGKYNQPIEIIPDLDKVSALSPRRETLRKNVREDVNAGIITPNEARTEIGYDAIEGANDLLVAAGKLPINFDVSESESDKSKYQKWLKSQGYAESFINEMTRLAYQGEN